MHIHSVMGMAFSFKVLIKTINNLKTFKMEVKIKDRVKEVEYLRMALAMSEFGVNYQHADLINMVSKETQELGDNFSLADGARILYKWKSKWEIYEYEQKKKDSEDKK